MAFSLLKNAFTHIHGAKDTTLPIWGTESGFARPGQRIWFRFAPRRAGVHWRGMAADKSVHRGAQFVRQWRLLRMLEGATRGMTAAQLKDAIEEKQSTRTLYRDLEVLQEAGFPLSNDDGCWRLLETSEGSWAIPVNPTEVVALMLTEDLLAPVEGSWLAEPLSNLRARLSSTLTPTGRRYCAELRKANVATASAAATTAKSAPSWSPFNEAIEKQHRVRITYATPGKRPEERTIDPDCTWFAAGRVYVVAYCHKAEDTRTFAVQRIKRAQDLDNPSSPILPSIPPPSPAKASACTTAPSTA